MNRHTAVALLAAAPVLAALGGAQFSSAAFTSTTRNAPSTVTAAADWTPPTVSLDVPAGPVSGVVTVAAEASDGETEIASVLLEYTAAGTKAWAPVCTATAAPYACDWDTAGLPVGVYALRATATDGTGLTASAESYLEVGEPAPVITRTMQGVGASTPVLTTWSTQEITGVRLGETALEVINTYQDADGTFAAEANLPQDLPAGEYGIVVTGPGGTSAEYRTTLATTSPVIQNNGVHLQPDGTNPHRLAFRASQPPSSARLGETDLVIQFATQASASSFAVSVIVPAGFTASQYPLTIVGPGGTSAPRIVTLTTDT
jgi:hypothetical protein